MWKPESFIKECLRLSDMDPLLILKDFAVRDGMTIPAGSTVNVPYLPHVSMALGLKRRAAKRVKNINTST
ncbi:hypothetical protein M378DRAFT_1001201 [Amanita muscaria Koide BX008]|uniref:Uncharacterized protein n=1 Tax=Amanita muscaria (strain Koide BX008) TaxID=946122 RepID=A0A0C2WS74_AMAMK|nr:hypothetical protein M378DRAFT_1001201 [Amanita muscaria Koide BX008]